MSEDHISVTDAIRDLRAQLIQAMEEGEDEKLRFRANSIELELTIGATDERRIGGGIRWHIFSLNAGKKESGTNTQRLKLVLTPIDPTTGEAANIGSDKGRGDRR